MELGRGMTLILWLMVSPGIWEVHTEVFKSQAECHRAEHVLMNAVPKYKWDHFKEIYEHGGGLGMMWIGCH